MATPEIEAILARTHPYDAISVSARAALAASARLLELEAGEVLQSQGTAQEALYLIVSGAVDVTDADGTLLSHLGLGNSFGERGLLRDKRAATTATTSELSEILAIPAEDFLAVYEEEAPVQRYFDRGSKDASARPDITTMALDAVMSKGLKTCSSDTSVQDAAGAMRGAKVGSLLVVDQGKLSGILTQTDITHKVVADALSLATAVSQIMTANPISLPPDALVADALNLMVEKDITHMPVTKDGQPLGILTQTDLTRAQAVSTANVIKDIARAPDVATLANATNAIPDLLVQLVGSHHAHQVVTRLITDVGDAVTRRLLVLAEEAFGPPPVPYLWAACGSQGRQEQTGVSDQDNCLILSDDMAKGDDAYFEAFAKFVCDGLDVAGYVYCPGDMMATNPRWRQPLRVWRGYFQRWIAKPDPEAQMLASVMFDLRAIGGEAALFEGLQAETLAEASKNSIFVAHMVSNSLKHTPPLGIFRGLATIRAGEHRDTIDMKHNGVVPVTDLGRIYALEGQITAVNTRARLAAAMAGGQVSGTGGRDLIDAYDLIAEARLQHQAALIKRGEAPDNFMAPGALSDFERAHLRDAFVVIKTMQAAAGSRGGYLS